MLSAVLPAPAAAPIVVGTIPVYVLESDDEVDIVVVVFSPSLVVLLFGVFVEVPEE